MTFPDIFDVKMLILANIFKDFHHHQYIYCIKTYLGLVYLLGIELSFGIGYIIK